MRVVLTWLMLGSSLLACSAGPNQPAAGFPRANAKTKTAANDASARATGDVCAVADECDGGTLATGTDASGASDGGTLASGASDAGTRDAGKKKSGLCTQSGDCEQAIPVTSAQHVDGHIDYPDPPPVGGNHNACWGSWGVHATPLAPEHWVHNLEHGGVIFLYHCPSGCSAEVSQMASFVKGHDFTLLTEYDALPKRFAVVAWGYRLVTDSFDLPAFQSFYLAHVDQAPESIDSNPPSSCP